MVVPSNSSANERGQPGLGSQNETPPTVATIMVVPAATATALAITGGVAILVVIRGRRQAGPYLGVYAVAVVGQGKWFAGSNSIFQQTPGSTPLLADCVHVTYDTIPGDQKIREKVSYFTSLPQ